MGEVEERVRLAAELRRIREGVRERALLEPARGLTPDPPTSRAPVEPKAPTAPEPSPPPAPPDSTAVNATWDVSKAPGAGPLGRLARRALSPLIAAQVGWNAEQVRLDNAILAYIDARLDATHRHYDAVLGIHGRHIQDANERHLILQEELVAHVHDLVKRIDLVLEESEKGRLGLEFALRDVRQRLARLEERLERG